MRTRQRSIPMVIFSLCLMAFAVFCVWTMFSDNPPERAIRDVPRMNAEACAPNGGVLTSNPTNDRAGNLTSMLTTCKDGTVKQVSPDYPNPKYVEYQKAHPFLGNEAWLFPIIIGSVIGMLGGIIGFAIFVCEMFD